MIKNLIFKLLMVCGSVAIGVIAVELLAELLLPAPKDGYYIFPPGFQTVLYPDSTILPGICGPSVFKINSIGIRGNEIPGAASTNYLIIGGSTAECLYLDQSETWPSILESKLNIVEEAPVWIGNGGKSGTNTNHHVAQLLQLIETAEFKAIDHIICLIGINDLNYYLANPGAYLSPTQSGVFEKAFTTFPNKKLPFVKRTRTWKGLKKLKQRFFGDEFSQNSNGSIYAQWRYNRKNADAIIEELPELKAALQHYRHNIEKLITTAEIYEKQISFVTQPVLWQDTMPAILQELLWMGGIGEFMSEGSFKYYSTAALKSGMDSFNSELMNTCFTNQVDVYDLSTRLPQDTTVFYDDCHFNEGGAIKVADFLFEHLNTGN